MLIVLLIALLLGIGVKQSVRFNTIIVFIKLFVIALFIFFATKHFNIENWHPFLPFGWIGVVKGAAIIFFSYIGFDAVATAAEETLNPQQNLPIGIIGSLVLCILLYIIVSSLLTGMAHYYTLNTSSPIADVFLRMGYQTLASVIAVGALAGITTVVLVMYYGLTRILLAITRDGLLPISLAKINPHTQTPVRIIILTAIIMAMFAGLVPIQKLVEMVNIGTLAAFAIVCGGVIVLRYKNPELTRHFKTPFSPFIPAMGVITCLYLMFHLSMTTWIRFIIWMIVGLAIYFFYGRRRVTQLLSGSGPNSNLVLKQHH